MLETYLRAELVNRRKEILMITRQFTRDELQMAFALAFVLHPSEEVAFEVLIRAADLMDALEQNEARRDRSEEHYKSEIPPEALLQFAVYCASFEWEMDQESPLPKKFPKYRPTRADLIVRYVKHLVWNNLLKANFSSLGIGLGCSLYDYRPKQIADLLELPDELSIRRVKGGINKQLMKRFRYGEVLTPSGNAIRKTLASDEDRELVQQALKAFTPWNTTHIPLAPKQSLLEKLFDENSDLTDWDRKHALLDPECGGLAGLIVQHNKFYARYRGEGLGDPNLRLFVPEFEDFPGPPVDRFKAPELTDREITLFNKRYKSRGARAGDLNSLLSELFECEVDESVIKVFEDWASPTNESPPAVLSQDNDAEGEKIPFVELRGGAVMEGMRILVIGASPFSHCIWPLVDEGHTMPFVSQVRPEFYHFFEESDWQCYYEDLFRNRIDLRIDYECVLNSCWSGSVCSITGGNLPVPIDSPTAWDFRKRSISDDLTQTLTPQSKIIDASRWRYDIFPNEPVWWGGCAVSLFDTRWEGSHWFSIRPLARFSSQREINHELDRLSYGLVISGRYQEDIPQSLTSFVRRTRGQLARMTFHWMEQEHCQDLKPFRPEQGLLVSDWYDRANARQTREWRYDIFPNEPVWWGGCPVSLFDTLWEGSWFSIRPLPRFSSQREINYELDRLSYGVVISGRYQEDIPQSLTSFVRRTRGQLARMTFHWMEQEHCQDLKPFRPEQGLLVSDWYDSANVRPTLDRLKSFLLAPNETDDRKARTDPWLDSSSPLWGMNSWRIGRIEKPTPT
jgi:hypothetical protein